MIMLVLEDKKKPISSRDGMKLCVETSTTFDEWVRQSEKDYQDMLVYLKENDFAKVGGINGGKCLGYARYDQNSITSLFLSDGRLL